MPDLYDLVDEQREAVLARDRAASTALVREYSRVVRGVTDELQDVLDRITQAKKDGLPIRPSWLDTELRLKSILGEVNKRMGQYVEAAQGVIESDIEDAGRMGAKHTEALLEDQLRAAGGRISFRRLNNQALQAISQITDRSALRDLLDSFGPDLSRKARDLLTVAIATGRHPETTARLLRDAVGTPLTRSVTIARTEAMRAYREGQHRSFQQNSDVLSGWHWMAKLARTTCPACWAMHGTFHKTEERLHGHPRCRCAMAPFTKTFEELGIPGVPESRLKAPEPGASRFLRLDESDQRAILGPGRYQAYQEGVTLREMAYTRRSKQWGPSIALRPVLKLEAS